MNVFGGQASRLSCMAALVTPRDAGVHLWDKSVSPFPGDGVQSGVPSPTPGPAHCPVLLLLDERDPVDLPERRIAEQDLGDG